MITNFITSFPIFSPGVGQGYVNVSLIGAGIGVVVALLLLLVAALVLKYYRWFRKTRKATPTQSASGSSIAESTDVRKTSSTGDEWRNVEAMGSSLISKQKEPDVIRSSSSRFSNINNDVDTLSPLALNQLNVSVS